MKTTDTTPLPSKQIKDIRGQRFTRLVVLAYAGRDKSGGALWRCVCDCGAETIATGGHLRSGHTRSCGCLQAETIRTVNVTHRMIHTPEYRSWAHIRSRCTNPNVPEYPRYGGRGIVMCDRWLNSFENFYADLGPRPSPQHSIERIDNDGPYAPENCKWAVRVEQANNTRRNHLITYQGSTKTIAQWAAELGIACDTLKRRILCGMSSEQALTQELRPVRKQRLLTHDGQTMTIAEWARKLGFSRQALLKRLAYGWSVEQTLTTPIGPNGPHKKPTKSFH